MVSKTSDDLPEPDTPVTTVSRLCGIASETSLRLWTRAPRMKMDSSKGMTQPGAASSIISGAAIRKGTGGAGTIPPHHSPLNSESLCRSGRPRSETQLPPPANRPSLHQPFTSYAPAPASTHVEDARRLSRDLGGSSKRGLVTREAAPV